MVKKLGFISNSSSSSFVILGIETKWKDNKEIDIYEYAQGEDLEVVYLENDNYVVGKSLADCDDYLGDANYSLEEMKKLSEEAKKKCEKMGIKGELKLYMGTRPS
jgi:hypothetical protein